MDQKENKKPAKQGAWEAPCDFMWEGTRIHLRFSENGPGFEELFKNYLISLKKE